MKGKSGMNDSNIDDFLNEPLQIINIGLEGFGRDLVSQNIPVTQVDWVPPAGGDPELADILSKLGS